MPLPKAPNKPATLLDLSKVAPARISRSPAARSTAASLPAALPEETVPVGTDDRASSAQAAAGVQPALAAQPAVAAQPALSAQPALAAQPVGDPPAGAALLRAAPIAPVTDLPSVGRDRHRPAAAGERRPARRAAPVLKKLFVVDTNVLMHDPSSLFRFAEHDVYLPMMTLEELDNHKRGMSEVSRNARQVSRSLDSLVAAVGDHAMDQGIELSALGNRDAGGRLFFQTQAVASMLPSSLPVGKADNQILGVVRALQDENPGREVVLVSKDINMRIKARALGLRAEDYFNDQVLEDTDLLYSGMLKLPDNFWDKHGKGIESWQQGGFTFYRISGPLIGSLMLNQFVYLDGEMPLVAQVKELNGRTAVLQTLKDYAHHKNAVWGITARNREQNFALNLLMNPEIDFVSLLGQAGTGKTLLTLAAGLAQTIEGKRFSEIIMTRATVPVGEDIGYLPGTEEEKMQPWMG
nr:PIN domain-containing protein [Burkholderiaceae bacterium]